MTPRVSVLLPVHDAGRTLESCLRSLARQREQAWEAVLVDDGSSDDSRAIAERFAAADPRLRVVPRAHAGLVASLNAGLAECRAPIVARLDADDWIHRDRLALQCDALDRAPGLDAVGCHVRLFPRGALTDGTRRYEAWLNGLADPDAIWRDRFVECPVAHPALAIRRERLVALAYRDRGWPEDFDLVLRLLADGPKLGIVPRRLLAWRDHPARASRNDGRYALDRFTACRADALARDFLRDRATYVLWGHGPTARALRRALAGHGRTAATIVEVHPRRIGRTIGGAGVVSPDELARRTDLLDLPLIASVSGAGPRAQIRAALGALGRRDGIDFVCAA